MYRRLYDTDSHTNPPLKEGGLSPCKCTAQKESKGEADTFLCQASFQAGWREEIRTHSKISNIVKQVNDKCQGRGLDHRQLMSGGD